MVTGILADSEIPMVRVTAARSGRLGCTGDEDVVARLWRGDADGVDGRHRGCRRAARGGGAFLWIAACRDVVAEHGGQGVEFSFGLEFSEELPGTSAVPEPEDEALPAVDNG